MDNITIDQMIAAASIVVTIFIAFIGGIYAVATNTTKYELTEDYKRELLNWYSTTVAIMIDMIHLVESGYFFDDSFKLKRTELLSKLSTQIEIGRFYFPNVIKMDGFGKDNPSAYQGYRHVNLEFLCHFYNTASKADSQGCVQVLKNTTKSFTSAIFDTIEPRKRNRLYSKYTGIAIPKGMSRGDYVHSAPDKCNVFSHPDS